MPNDFLQSFLAGRQEGAVNRRQNEALGQQQAEMLQQLGLAQSQMSERKRQFDLEQAFRAQQAKAQQEHLSRQEQMEAARSVAGGLINPVGQGQVTSNPNGMFELGGQMYTPATLQNTIDRAKALDEAKTAGEIQRDRLLAKEKMDAVENYFKTNPAAFKGNRSLQDEFRLAAALPNYHPQIPQADLMKDIAESTRELFFNKSLTPEQQKTHSNYINFGIGKLKEIYQSKTSPIPAENRNDAIQIDNLGSEVYLSAYNQAKKELGREPNRQEMEARIDGVIAQNAQHLGRHALDVKTAAKKALNEMPPQEDVITRIQRMSRENQVRKQQQQTGQR